MNELIPLELPEPEFAPEGIGEMQQLLIDEVSQLGQQLGKILDEIFATNISDALDTLIQRYDSALQRLVDTAQIAELTGLEQLCLHIKKNIHLLTIDWLNTNRSQSHIVLRQWPDLVRRYLSEPGNDEICLLLINHLELAGWPDPINEKEARKLLEELISSGVIDDPDKATQETIWVADIKDMDLRLPDNLDRSLLDAFLHDAPTQASQLSMCMASLTGDQNDQEIISQSQRLTHTMKGAANIVGIKGIATIAHIMEDVFEQLQAQTRLMDDNLNILLQSAADCIEAMVDFLQGKDIEPEDRFDIYSELIFILNGSSDRIEDTINEVQDKPFSENTKNTDTDVAPQIPDQDSNSAITVDEAVTVNNAIELTTNQVETVRVPLPVISSLFQLAEEITIALGSTQEQTQRIFNQLKLIQEQDQRIQEQRFELENVVDVRAAASRQRTIKQSLVEQPENNSEFDSLEMDQYDEIYDVAHALIESVSDSREMSRDVEEQILSLDSLLLQQSRLNKDLQRLVKNTRMVSVHSLLPRLQRCIRHASRITGKLVDFSVSGSETEINEDILDKLVDPVMHLLRNAVDHGIESPEIRANRNKSPEGKINLAFSQDGQHILIRCDDDGSGIDENKIVEKAIQKGLIGASDILNQTQIHQLLFTPGFSTKDTSTQVSGRGIGMDAAYKSIRNLSGQLTLSTKKSGGTRFEIKVPLQLVASHALLIQICNQWFAVPTRQLNQILPPEGSQLTYIGDQPAIEHEGELFPARHLGQMLGMQTKTVPNQWSKQPILLTQSNHDSIAICVDKVIANQDLVIKSTGDYVKNLPGISGVSILGDGRVIPVLDLDSLMEHEHPLITTHDFSDSPETILSTQSRILIVDDSLSVRKSLTQMVGDAGYQSETARDGLDAWEKISKNPPTVVLVDMEMPRMNGIELTNRMRNHDISRDIPVLMITSRSTQKHRNVAEKAGVTEYFTKPFSESDLLHHIDGYLKQHQRGMQ